MYFDFAHYLYFFLQPECSPARPPAPPAPPPAGLPGGSRDSSNSRTSSNNSSSSNSSTSSTSSTSSSSNDSYDTYDRPAGRPPPLLNLSSCSESLRVLHTFLTVLLFCYNMFVQN